MAWRKITIVGAGLLGGSLGLAIKKRGIARQVHGYVRRPASIDECKNLGVADQVTCDLAEAVTGADLVVLCTPIAPMTELVKAMMPALEKDALVTDVGSVKNLLAEELDPLFANSSAAFIGSHPMAGAETMGVRFARADLFENAVCAITPTSRSDPKALKKVEKFWEALGARPMIISPRIHDELVARSSHLPHVLAAELANYVLSPVHPKEQALLCASGFRDTTRIASGSPEMWRDIALANRTNLSRVLGVLIEDLQEFRHALESGEAKSVEEFFAIAKHRRDQWTGPNASPE